MGKRDREEKEASKGEAAKLVTSEGTWGSVVLGREPQGQGGSRLRVSKPEAGGSGHNRPAVLAPRLRAARRSIGSRALPVCPPPGLMFMQLGKQTDTAQPTRGRGLQ